jgi:hypothetical protein
MKWGDYSHSKPRIYLPKPYITAIAKLIKHSTDLKHRQCVTLVGNCFCGVDKCFNEYHDSHRFDIDFRTAMEEHVDIVVECINALSKRTGVNTEQILAILKQPIQTNKSNKPFVAHHTT